MSLGVPATIPLFHFIICAFLLVPSGPSLSCPPSTASTWTSLQNQRSPRYGGTVEGRAQGQPDSRLVRTWGDSWHSLSPPAIRSCRKKTPLCGFPADPPASPPSPSLPPQVGPLYSPDRSRGTCTALPLPPEPYTPPSCVLSLTAIFLSQTSSKTIPALFAPSAFSFGNIGPQMYELRACQDNPHLVISSSTVDIISPASLVFATLSHLVSSEFN